MDIEKLTEKGARVVERAAHDAFLFGDTSYRRAAGALIALTLNATSEEADRLNETLRSKALEDFIHGLDAFAEQVEKDNV